MFKCKEDISVEHILYNCEIPKTLYKQNNIQLDTTKDIKLIQFLHFIVCSQECDIRHITYN